MNVEPTRRSLANLPVLYQKYIGHDNNRESLLANMPESESIARVCYREWFPQIVFNQHQSGPAGAVLFVGAMRDPSNPYLDPLMAPSMELVSAAVHTRFVSEGKPGAVARSGASYQNWWNGGVRSTACFHNEIGILSEITGSPTPTEIAFVPKNLIMSNDNPYPVEPQPWHFRQAIEYLLSANRAILSLAAEHRESFLYNIYRMGRNSIDKGSRDSWTMTAKKVANIQAAAARDGVTAGGRSGTPRKYFDQLHDPATRDARGYVIPSDQPDFLTAIKFVNALIKNGVTVLRASRPFQLGGRSYPANSFVVKAAQAFRPHVMDCFEPQDYPDDFAYPGGPPIRPVRRDRLYAGVPDGRAVRPRARRDRRPVRGRRGVRQGGTGVRRHRRRGRVPAEPPAQRRVHRREPAAGGRRVRVLAEGRGGAGGRTPATLAGRGPARSTSRSRSRRRRSSRPSPGIPVCDSSGRRSGPRARRCD